MSHAVQPPREGSKESIFSHTRAAISEMHSSASRPSGRIGVAHERRVPPQKLCRAALVPLAQQCQDILFFHAPSLLFRLCLFYITRPDRKPHAQKMRRGKIRAAQFSSADMDRIRRRNSRDILSAVGTVKVPGNVDRHIRSGRDLHA